MKSVPNIITVSRIFLSLALLFIKPYSSAFYLVYIMCGLSDGLDGYIARRTNTESSKGALLDTIADMVMVIALFIILLPIIKIPVIIIYWIIIIAIIRITGIIFAYFKYNVLVMLHTYSNKLTGIVIFLLIMFYQVVNSLTLMSIVCIIASIASIEELIIHITSKKLDRDRKSIFTD